MKTRFLSALLVVLMLASALVMPASAADQVLGQYLYTEIVAYIDNKPLRSYNILGNTYIVVEDLMDYGFAVTWDGVTGRLVIDTKRVTTDPTKYTANYTPNATTQPAGMPAGDYYFTAVTTWIGDTQINGYNIGGYTCIWFDDLAPYFAETFVWSPENKALYMTSPAPVVIDSTLAAAVDKYVANDRNAFARRNYTDTQKASLDDFAWVYGGAAKADFIALLDEIDKTISHKVTATKKTSSTTAEVTVDVTCRDLDKALADFLEIWKKMEAEGKVLPSESALTQSMNLILSIFGDNNLPTATKSYTVYLDLVNGVWTVNVAKSEAFVGDLVGGMVNGTLFV